MSLDVLYDAIKNLDYPINSRGALEFALGETVIVFEGGQYDARNIANTIEQFPIQSPAVVIKNFIEGYEEYNPHEGELLGASGILS